jgi:hypothetical protein
MHTIDKLSLLEKFTMAEKREIVKDWLAELPDMGNLKAHPTGFRRRVGPLLISIVLEPKTSFAKYYEVSCSVHNLAEQNDFLSAALSSGMIGYTDYTDHKQKYKELIQTTKTKAYIKVDGPISLDEIFQGFVKYHNKMLNICTTTGLYQVDIPVYIATWAGEIEKAKEYLEWAKNVPNLYSGGMPVTNPNWAEDLEKVIENPEELRKTTREEVKKFGLSEIPYQDIVGVRYKELES